MYAVLAGVEPVDTSPFDLRVTLDQAPLPFVAHLQVRIGGVPVEFRALAASHQVIVGDGLVVETVACGLPAGDPLADGARRSAPGWRFAASVRHLGRPGFARRVRWWEAQARRDPAVLAARYPSHPDALTALRRVPGGWTGVHTYPAVPVDGPEGSGTIVVTRSWVAPRPPGGRVSR
jgi:hypothetical protein